MKSDAIEAQASPRFLVRLAQTEAEIIQSQALRYRVFATEMGASLNALSEGLDRDQFDRHCRHLLVIDNITRQIVASTRMLDADGARAAGGFYSAQEFSIDRIAALPGRLLEIGRTCVAAEHRNGAVIGLLWQGIAQHIRQFGYDYLFGCASIGLEDGGANAHAVLERLRVKHACPVHLAVQPYVTLPRADIRLDGAAKLPPLLKAYLSLGAQACGEGYWDQDFNCVDVLMVLDVSELNPRYARHFFKAAPQAGTAALV